MKQSDNTAQFSEAALHSVLSNSSDMIFIKNNKLEYLNASIPFSKLVGFPSPSGIMGKTDFDLFNNELADKYRNDDKNVIESGNSIIDMIEPLPESDGGKRFSSTSKYPIIDKDNNIIGLYGIGRDITVNIMLEEAMERREQTNSVFADVIEFDLTKNALINAEGGFLSKELNKLGSISFDKTTRFIAENYIHPSYKDEFIAHFEIASLEKAYNQGEKLLTFITYINLNEGYKWVEYTDRLYFSRITNTLKMVSYIKDMNEHIKSRENLKRIARTDALTGLMNRKALIEEISECLENNVAKKTHALFFIDLDCFKNVNDTMGHPFGDKVLKCMAERIGKVFSNEDIIGRFGGDEFLVLLRDVTLIQARQKAMTVLQALPCEIEENGVKVCVTCSIGIAMHVGGDKSFDELYAQADKAMYNAKKTGKSRICVFK